MPVAKDVLVACIPSEFTEQLQRELTVTQKATVHVITPQSDEKEEHSLKVTKCGLFVFGSHFKETRYEKFREYSVALFQKLHGTEKAFKLIVVLEKTTASELYNVIPCFATAHKIALVQSSFGPERIVDRINAIVERGILCSF